jgi:predicted AAA+ superfamily ATPase
MPIFSYSIKAQQINPKKIYCVDTGLRNAVGFRFSEDIGRIAENAVFVHLKRTGKNVFYWRNDKGQEIDFIVKEKFKPSVAIQVCWNFTEDVKERELESLIAGMQKLKLSTGYVLTEDFEAEERVGRKKIIFIPLWKWFLEISRQATSG